MKNIRTLSANAVIRRVTRAGTVTSKTIGGTYIPSRRSITRRRPDIIFSDRRSAQKTLRFGHIAITNGTAARLILTAAHIPRDITVSMTAWTARRLPRASFAELSRSHAVTAKNTAGASDASDTALVHSAAARLRRKKRLSSSSRDIGTLRLSEHILHSLSAAAQVSGAAVMSRSTMHSVPTDICTALLPEKSAIGCISPKYSSKAYTAASADRNRSPAPSGRMHIIIVRARRPRSTARE